jgi:coenzyme F420-0:L-glutamate ligase/coenzyme F420-1:gamma-L-glutamate ligase
VSSGSTRPLRQSERRYLTEHRVGRLATVDSTGRPHAIPVCFAVTGDTVFLALDEKPKTVDPRDLKRVRNLVAEPAAALLVDDYSDDWRQLSYVLVRGIAHLVEPGDNGHFEGVSLLRDKYPQYVAMAIERQPLIQLDLTAATSWSWAGDRFPAD